MKKILIIILLMVMSACAKKAGTTSSKIKLFSGGHAALLTSKANNGMILYGRSLDGKRFTKKIDADSVDLIFPNGTWNFYAIAWELVGAANPVPNFAGKTYCGKSPAQVLNGPDVTVQIDLTNANCADPEFSAYSANQNPSAEVVFPRPNFFNCKDISTLAGVVTDYNRCDQNLGANFNKGYATSYKLVAYEFASFGPSDSIAPRKIAESVCVRTDSTLMTGMLDSTDAVNLNNVRIPTTLGNGFAVAVQVFYSPTACDPAMGVDEFPMTPNPRMKIFPELAASVATNYSMFIQTNAADVCRAPRMNPGVFASGMGTPSSPFAICTKEQFGLLSSQFTTYRLSSFDLLSDINFGMAQASPIGEALTADGTPAVSLPYSGTFNGNNHKISNFIINCRTPSGTVDNSDVGLFRYIKDATIKNLTINSSVVMCKTGTNVGLLSGQVETATSGTILENLKVHGHTEGGTSIGGVVGKMSSVGSGSIVATSIHMKGEPSGEYSVGGFFGTVSMGSGGSATISRSTFKGSVHSRSNTSGNSAVVSRVGGVIGDATSVGAVSLSEVAVRADQISGSTTVGGFVGSSSNIAITDSYVEANLRAYSSTDAAVSTYANIGGAIGLASGGTLTRVLAAYGTKAWNPITPSGTPDHSMGGLVGRNTAAPVCTNSFYTGTNDASNGVGCGAPSLLSSAHTQTTYTSAGWDFATAPIWSMPDNGYDIPRLNFEYGIESVVTYLKRECSGHYTTQAGTGTATDPKWICSEGQLDTMRADHTSNFILKKNIYYTGTVNAFTPFPAGVYKLDGNSYGLYQFTMTLPSIITASLNYGLFEDLQTGSLIRNLYIGGAELTSAVGTVTGTPLVNVGLLAGINGGSIVNVHVDQSKAVLNATATANSSFYFGGAVGVNGGTISNSTFDIQSRIDRGSFPAGSLLFAASAVAKNQGTIQGIRSHASLSRVLSCLLSENVNTSAQENFAGLVAKNDAGGMIKEVDSQGELRVELTPSGGCPITTAGQTSTFVANNVGTIMDFSVNPKIYYMSGGTSPAPELFSSNTGTVARGFATFETPDANKVIPQSHSNMGSWVASSNIPTLTSTCLSSQVGEYYIASDDGGSTPIPGVVAGDYITCASTDGINFANVIASASVKNQILNVAPMTDVLYLVRTPVSIPPALIAGRYFDQDLLFSLGSAGSGLKVETATPPTTLFDHPTGWTVATDFLNPGSSAWVLDFFNSTSTTSEVPKLLRTDGNMEQLGPGF